MGTAAYMSLEQAKGKRVTGVRMFGLSERCSTDGASSEEKRSPPLGCGAERRARFRTRSARARPQAFLAAQDKRSRRFRVRRRLILSYSAFLDGRFLHHLGAPPRSLGGSLAAYAKFTAAPSPLGRPRAGSSHTAYPRAPSSTCHTASLRESRRTPRVRRFACRWRRGSRCRRWFGRRP